MFDIFKSKPKDESWEDQRKDLERFPIRLSQGCLNGLSCDKLPEATGDFGRCASSPIPVNGPIGEMKYLQRMRTSDGTLIFHRLGSYKNEFGVIDIFETVSSGGKIWDILYFDMYHPRRSTLTPSGYTFSKLDWSKGFVVGSSTNKFDPDFPFGLSRCIKEDFGSGGVVKDRSKFTRPLRHIERLAKLSFTSQFK